MNRKKTDQKVILITGCTEFIAYHIVDKLLYEEENLCIIFTTKDEEKGKNILNSSYYLLPIRYN